MKTEEEINKRIRDLFIMTPRSCYDFGSREQMQEVAVLHWVLDDKAIFPEKTTEKKRRFL